MIGLDTNVLVRLVVGDDPQQTNKAKRFVDRHCTLNSPGFVNCVVLTEFVWVLAGTYGYRRAEIVAAVQGLLVGGDRVVEHHDAVRASLESYKAGRAAFTDALIGQINRTRGCQMTATFDRNAAKLEGFMPIS